MPVAAGASPGTEAVMRALIVLGPYCVIAGILVLASAILFARLRAPSTIVMCVGSLLLFGAQIVGSMQAAGVWGIALPDAASLVAPIGNCGAVLFAAGLLLLALRTRREDATKRS